MAKKRTCKTSMTVQTVLFDRSLHTVAQAKTWLRANDFKAVKVDTKKKYHRFRQVAPGRCRFMRFGESFKKGVRPVFCCPK